MQPHKNKKLIREQRGFGKEEAYVMRIVNLRDRKQAKNALKIELETVRKRQRYRKMFAFLQEQNPFLENMLDEGQTYRDADANRF